MKFEPTINRRDSEVYESWSFRVDLDCNLDCNNDNN